DADESSDSEDYSHLEWLGPLVPLKKACTDDGEWGTEPPLTVYSAGPSSAYGDGDDASTSSDEASQEGEDVLGASTNEEVEADGLVELVGETESILNVAEGQSSLGRPAANAEEPLGAPQHASGADTDYESPKKQTLFSGENVAANRNDTVVPMASAGSSSGASSSHHQEQQVTLEVAALIEFHQAYGFLCNMVPESQRPLRYDTLEAIRQAKVGIEVTLPSRNSKKAKKHLQELNAMRKEKGEKELSKDELDLDELIEELHICRVPWRVNRGEEGNHEWIVLENPCRAGFINSDG
ncbi:15035_t:CDS:2, partial [Acaulospora colombiana]